MLIYVNLGLIIIYGVFCITRNQYVNIAKDKTAWQSSNNVNYKWFASAAVDGGKNTYLNSDTCAVARGLPANIWRVDLGNITTVHYVDIYYRTEGSQNWLNTFRWRMAGFFLYISNTTNREDGHLCYHEIQTTHNPLTPIMSIPCVQTGRYVIYYNERNGTGVTYPSYYDKNVYNALCEVEVYACDFLYGSRCASKCGNCLNGEQCNPVNGTCLNGCAPGWKDDKCKQECPSGKYGSGCSNACSTNCNSKTCNHVDGACTQGCKVGWKGFNCTQVCDDFFYGDNCSLPCGKCWNEEKCNNINGSCPGECAAGWKGDICTLKCDPGTYGHGCTQNCSENCYGCNADVCDQVTGRCTRGCISGWHGNQCYKVGNDMTFQQCEGKSASNHVLIVAITGWILNGILIVALLIVVQMLRKSRNSHKPIGRDRQYEDINMDGQHDNHTYTTLD